MLLTKIIIKRGKLRQMVKRNVLVTPRSRPFTEENSGFFWISRTSFTADPNNIENNDKSVN